MQALVPHASFSVTSTPLRPDPCDLTCGMTFSGRLAPFLRQGYILADKIPCFIGGPYLLGTLSMERAWPRLRRTRVAQDVVPLPKVKYKERKVRAAIFT